jgi:hypothetical protein
MRIALFVRPYAFVLIALFCAAACSSHRDTDDDDERDEDAGAAGRAGRGGGGGAGGAAGSGPAAVRCGSAQCPAPVSLLSAIPIPTGIPAPVACCVDESKATCGTAAMPGATCEPVAVADTRCPGIDLGALNMLAGGAAPGGEMMMSGCCIDNACGLDGALFGRGCVENGEVASMLSGIPLISTLVSVPAPRACDAPPDTELDAGSEDAG